MRPEATSVYLGGKAIHQITALPVSEARAFFAVFPVEPAEAPIADPIISEIFKRLVFLEKVGVEYLTLDRPADTLSGGPGADKGQDKSQDTGNCQKIMAHLCRAYGFAFWIVVGKWYDRI
mgnify:CR=1 FL=1